jgi:hypothetical protein
MSGCWIDLDRIDAHHAAGTDGTPLRGDASTVFCTQYSQKDWHQRLGSGVHADAIMDRIIHNTIWVETGNYNMRDHTAHRTAVENCHGGRQRRQAMRPLALSRNITKPRVALILRNEQVVAQSRNPSSTYSLATYHKSVRLLRRGRPDSIMALIPGMIHRPS